jgi:hypothetical protein
MMRSRAPKKTDAEGNATECNAAVRRAQELYGIQ